MGLTEYRPLDHERPTIPPPQTVTPVASSGAMSDELLHGLSDAQRQAVTCEAPQLAILAGAGSGKTRVLTRRVAWQVANDQVDPRHVLVITFTRKAAQELSHRLQAFGFRDRIAAGTFHSIAFGQLRTRWAEQGIDPPSLLTNKNSFIRRVLNDLGVDASPPDVLAEIEWAKARLIKPADYATRATESERRTSLSGASVGDVYAAYERTKRSRRVVDFDDLLRTAALDLQNDRAFAAATHWRFRHVLVDEFQDVNPLQFTLLNNWLGDREDLCVVGDPNQAIYSWNGADPRYLTHFPEYFPESDQVLLDHNFRSSPQIIAVANATIDKSPTGRPQVATRPDSKEPVIVGYATDAEEAAGVARAARDLHRPGSTWRNQAVLVRTRSQIRPIVDAFAEVGIPTVARDDNRLVDDPEAKLLLQRLRSTGLSFSIAISDLDAELDDIDPSTYTPAQMAAAELISLARDYEATQPNPSNPGFVAWLHDSRDGDTRFRGDAVEITTFHAAKGLEWPIVHLAGLEEGFVPISHARDDSAVAEERRLLYVAITRAEVTLRATWAESRTFNGRVQSRRPSPWLSVFTEGSTPRQVLADPTDFLQDARAALRSVPATGGIPAADAPDEESLSGCERVTYEALLAWRQTLVRGNQVPPESIFHDRTLVTIVRSAPTSVADLLDLPGVGPIKGNRYGDALLGVLRASAS